jgi:hypothetical protein
MYRIQALPISRNIAESAMIQTAIMTSIAARFFSRRFLVTVWAICFLILCQPFSALSSRSFGSDGETSPDYQKDVQPLLLKYCGNCHSGTEKEGEFSIASLETLMAGTPKGAVIMPRDGEQSKLIGLIRGKIEPKMPPEEEPQPTEAEINLIASWINAGALASASAPPPLRMRLNVPKIAAKSNVVAPYTSAIVLPGGIDVLLGRYGELEQVRIATGEVVKQWKDFAGKVTSLRLSSDGKAVIAAGGVEGVGGEVAAIDIASGELRMKLEGHSDIIYSAVLSPDNKVLATAGYDRAIRLWDVTTGQVIKTLLGHNGAIYDLDFDPTGRVLASASADETVKLWQVSTGTRLDTLSQGEKEQYAVRFDPNGKSIFAAGADKKIRRWQLVSIDQPAINPIREARFAHEGAVLGIRVSRDGRWLMSVGQDGTVKQWTTPDLRLAGTLVQNQTETVAAEFQSASSDDVLQNVVSIARKGKPLIAPLFPEPGITDRSEASMNQIVAATGGTTVQEVSEIEPNSVLAQAMPLTIPASVKGVIDPATAASDAKEDVDIYRFTAKKGEVWIAEIHAARGGSPLDSRVDIMSADGSPVLRVNLQAVRESYFTFRGKDSATVDDFRLHKWQEMELNEYLYSDGEVVKLWLYPRGPDSGFKVYPGYGSRYTFFDTTATAHALGAPAYVVQPLAPSESPILNGLPTFPIYYENDDESQREWGNDSKLTFTAPADGDFLVRVRDSRGFGGPEHKYSLTLRPSKPDFEVKLENVDLTIPVSRGREFTVTAKRIDGFEGPINIELQGLPEGLQVTTPLTIEAGQNKAIGTIFANQDTKIPTEKEVLEVGLKAVAQILDGNVEHAVNGILKLRLAAADAKPEVAVLIEPLKLDGNVDANPIREIEIVVIPGTTTSAKLRIERNGQEGPIAFGNEDCGRNLPHGVFVDNIGLNGLLLPDGQTEREFFITAAPWVKPQVRYFHLRSQSAGNPTSRPIKIRIGNP